MEPPKRRPFNQRVENPPGLWLTPRDRAVIISVYECRFLLREQIQRLYFPSRKTANDRLHRLYQHRYLQRLFLPQDARRNARNTQACYCLDEEGARLIAAETDTPREKIEWHPERNKVKQLFLKHQLKTNDVRIGLTLAAQARGDRLVQWIPEWELRALKEQIIDKKTGERYPIRPDGYFIYEYGKSGKQQHFFLEVDMATERNKVFERKIKGYQLYKRSGAYHRHYQTHSLRILTVTTSARRLKFLKETTEEAGGKSLFWFATFADVEPETVLGPVWEIAGQGGKARLIE